MTSTALIVPLDPAIGWGAADRWRRFAALLAVPLAALLGLLVLDGPSELPQAVVIGWLVLGPPCFYSLARVLRPEPVGRERTARHLLASTAMAYAVPTLVATTQPGLGVQFVFGPPAYVLGVSTSVWGLAALVGRLFRRMLVAA